MIKSLEEAKERIPSQRDRILSLLREAGKNGVLNSQIQNICSEGKRRVRELYEMGYKIEVVPIGDGLYRYTLLSEPERVRQKTEKAIDILTRRVSEQFGGVILMEELKTLLDDEGFQVVRKYGFHK